LLLSALLPLIAYRWTMRQAWCGRWVSGLHGRGGLDADLRKGAFEIRPLEAVTNGVPLGCIPDLNAAEIIERGTPQKGNLDLPA
jgi:hypothetical protein